MAAAEVNPFEVPGRLAIRRACDDALGLLAPWLDDADDALVVRLRTAQTALRAVALHVDPMPDARRICDDALADLQIASELTVSGPAVPLYGPATDALLALSEALEYSADSDFRSLPTVDPDRTFRDEELPF